MRVLAPNQAAGWPPSCAVGFSATEREVHLLAGLVMRVLAPNQADGWPPSCAVEFSAAEREVYLRVHKEARAEFERYVAVGSSHVSSNLLAIMSLLNPLRLICSGGALREKVSFPPSSDVTPSLAPLPDHSIFHAWQGHSAGEAVVAGSGVQAGSRGHAEGGVVRRVESSCSSHVDMRISMQDARPGSLSVAACSGRARAEPGRRAAGPGGRGPQPGRAHRRPRMPDLLQRARAAHAHRLPALVLPVGAVPPGCPA